MLRFYASCDESVPAATSLHSSETERTRRMVVLYYLADASVEIFEPRVANSGLMQGPVLKRTPCPVDSAVLLLGTSVSLFGRSYALVGCDAFTRAYFKEKGIVQAADDPSLQEVPSPEVGPTAREPSAGQVFLANDGKLLSFSGLLADEGAEGGVRQVLLNFYLADATAELLDSATRSLVLRRQAMPLEGDSGLPSTGVAALGPDPAARFLRPQHLRIGAAVSLFKQKVTLLDADPFTRGWYASAGTEQPPAIPGPAPPAPHTRPPLPPHTGWGSEADSARSCFKLVPKAHSSDKNFGQFMTFSGLVLRFQALMTALPGRKALDASDVGRSFVVSFFLEDDTMAIFEPGQRDRPAERYLERTRVCHPGTDTSFAPADLRVGAALEVFGRRFELQSCDDFTTKFIAEHPEMWG